MTAFLPRTISSAASTAGAWLIPSRRRLSLSAFTAATVSTVLLTTSTPAAFAQEMEPAEQGIGGEEGIAEVFDGLFDDSEDEEDAPASATREAAPNTDNCPHALLPPEPVTTSEVVAPGQQSPAPLPEVPDENCGVQAPAGFHVNDDVLASAWMVSDLDTGEIVAMKDPHGRYRPASILKVLLALESIEELDLKKQVIGTDEDAAIDGSAVGIGPGGRYTVEQLLQGLLMASGNDAAHALAQQLGGDNETLTKINTLASELGARSTFAASYSGLDAPGMSTSAADMALLYTAAFRNPTFARIVGTDSVKFPGYGELEGYELGNDNGLFMNDPNGIGGKTGYTDDANHTFVGALDRDGRRLMAVILDTTIDHGPRAWEQAQMLLDEAYKFPAGQGVSTLDEINRTDAEEESPTPAAPVTNASAADARAAELDHNQPSWMPWIIVGGVAVLVIAVISSLLLLRRPSGRGRHAAH